MKFPSQAFILCAGKGTRMHPDTLDRPKCMLDVAGQPVIRRILDWLKSYEIKEVIINLHWKAELVINDLIDYQGMSIHFSIEDELLGTAGGIKNCIDLLHGQFLVVYGDVLTNLNLFKMFGTHHNRNAALTMVSHKVTNPWDCGMILSKSTGEVVDIWEKPDRDKVVSDEVSAGIMQFKKSCFDLMTYGNFDIARDLIPKLIGEKWSVYHYPLRHGEWAVDMGTRINYNRAIELCRL
jgi:NDP-sugar pyrophosphorylase family protein